MDAFKSQSHVSPPLDPNPIIIHNRLLSLPMSTLTLQPFADLIRHGKHARAAQSVDPSQADGHPNARDQRLHEQQQAERRERVEREHDRQDHVKDKAQTKEVAEAIVKEENAAKERMPYIKGLERFKILAKMGECVSFSPTALLTDLMLEQRCILTRIQGSRYPDRPESCQ